MLVNLDKIHLHGKCWGRLDMWRVTTLVRPIILLNNLTNLSNKDVRNGGIRYVNAKITLTGCNSSK